MGMHTNTARDREWGKDHMVAHSAAFKATGSHIHQQFILSHTWTVVVLKCSFVSSIFRKWNNEFYKNIKWPTTRALKQSQCQTVNNLRFLLLNSWMYCQTVKCFKDRPPKWNNVCNNNTTFSCNSNLEPTQCQIDQK